MRAREATQCRGGSACFNCLVFFATRLTQLRMQIDQARRHDEAGSIDNSMRVVRMIDVIGHDACVFDEQRSDAIDPLAGQITRPF